MSDLKDSMRRAGDSLPPQDVSYERLLARRERKRRNSRLGSAIVAAVVAAGAIGGVVAALSLHGSQTQDNHGKKSVAAGPDLQAGPGQYYYWKTVRVMPGGSLVEELWWGEDGSGRYQADTTNPNYGVPENQSWGAGEFPGVRPFETDLSTLSSDPSVLLGQLRDRTSPGGASPEPDVTLAPGLSPETSSMWRSIQNIVEMGNATPALRAAIFEVASGLPGAEGRAHVTDPVGRPATELLVVLGDYYGGGGGHHEDSMWFDPETHQLLASDGDLGTSPSFIVMAGGIVDSRSETVAPGGGFIPAPTAAVPGS
jgi:hypothetical protein